MARKPVTVKVRRATVRDAKLLSALNADVQAIHAAALPSRFKPAGSFPETAAAELLASTENMVFIGYVGRSPAGYVYVEIIRRPETSLTYAYQAIHVHHLSVGPRRRRKGVGASLLETVRAEGLKLGITLLTADVWSFNQTAQSFFRRCGFTQSGERLWRE